jgi:hypothetical protein
MYECLKNKLRNKVSFFTSNAADIIFIFDLKPIVATNHYFKNHRGRLLLSINLNGCCFHSINKKAYYLLVIFGSNIFNLSTCQNLSMEGHVQRMHVKLMLNNYHTVEVTEFKNLIFLNNLFLKV